MSDQRNKPITDESVSLALSTEGPAFRSALEVFAKSGDSTGWPLEGDLRVTAQKYDLVYRSTGRLRPVALKLLQGVKT